MKKLLAIFAVVLTVAAVAADAQTFSYPDGDSPFANNPYYTNTDARGDEYWDVPYYPWTKDYEHGQPGNPYNLDREDVVGEDGEGTYSDFIQFDEEGTFMWQTGTFYPRPRDGRDQTFYEQCKWMDYPEYVGCTQYFYLFVYEPLCITCICEGYKCLGIYTIPSFHNLNTGNNPFATSYGCWWSFLGQDSWLVVASGEIQYQSPDGDNIGGVMVDWKWVGDQSNFALGLGAVSGSDSFTDDSDTGFHRIIALDVNGAYYIGLYAASVSVAPGAEPGVHSWEATVSGFYYF